MITGLFPQTVIAIIWDFDKTLTPTYMQAPLFEHFKEAGVTVGGFFDEVKRLEAYYKNRDVAFLPDTLYLNRLLTYVQGGKLPGLNNRLLRELGGEIKFYPGMPEFLKAVKDIIENDPDFSQYEIKLEHYIVSTGLQEMIEGSLDTKGKCGVEGIWGCTFIEEIPPPGFADEHGAKVENSQILQFGYVIDNTSKTRAVFEINKGTNKRSDIHVNARIDKAYRRVPFQNMIYIADGPSDIPVFSIINQYGGKTYAVYNPSSKDSFATAYNLQHEQGRVQAFGEANYTDGSHTYRWIVHSAQEIAKRIARDCERFIEEKVKKPPIHLGEPQEKTKLSIEETNNGKKIVGEETIKVAPLADDRPVSFEEFRSLVGKAGLKANEREFRRSYDALISLRSNKHISWMAIRGKARKLEEDSKVGRSQGDLIQGEAKELAAARIPLTPEGWERY